MMLLKLLHGALVTFRRGFFVYRLRKYELWIIISGFSLNFLIAASFFLL